MSKNLIKVGTIYLNIDQITSIHDHGDSIDVHFEDDQVEKFHEEHASALRKWLGENSVDITNIG